MNGSAEPAVAAGQREEGRMAAAMNLVPEATIRAVHAALLLQFSEACGIGETVHHHKGRKGHKGNFIK